MVSVASVIADHESVRVQWSGACGETKGQAVSPLATLRGPYKKAFGYGDLGSCTALPGGVEKQAVAMLSLA